MRWLRLWTDIIADPKIKMLAFEDRWHFVAILCMKRHGDLDGETGELLHRMVGATLGLGDRERDEVRRRLMDVNLVDENWQPKSWNKRQFSSDSSTHRVREFRKRFGNVPKSFRKRHRNGPETEQRQSKSREESHPPPSGASGCEGLNPQAWTRWRDYRKEIRRPIKSASLLAAQRKLAGYGADQIAVVEQSIANGWQGLFDLRANGGARAAEPVRTWEPPEDEHATV